MTTLASAAPPRRPAPRARASRRERRMTRTAWLFAAPFVVLFVVFMAGPIDPMPLKPPAASVSDTSCVTSSSLSCLGR